MRITLHTYLAYLIGCVLLLGSSACSSSKLAKLNPADGCWKSQERLSFELEIAENGSFPADIAVDFSDVYGFSNIYLKLSWTSPSGKTAFTRVSESFIDPIGNWQVEKAASTYPYEFQSFKGLTFEEGGLYRFELTHDMRKEPLCGVQAVKVSVVQ